MSQPSLVWLRNDLRLDDHMPLQHAIQKSDGQVVVLYCLDPRHFALYPVNARQPLENLPKTGSHRATFIFEALADLRQSLRGLGSDLIIRRGRPEEEVPRLAAALGVHAVTFHEEVCDEELEVERGVTAGCAEHGIACIPFWGSTLYHRDDLPFDPAELPRVFTQFRKAVERHADIRPPVAAPKQLRPLPDHLEPGPLPTLAEVGLEVVEPDSRSTLPSMRGGEQAVRGRIKAYFWDNDQLRYYKKTRNGLLGPDYSSKFAPWLAVGCVSPRRIAQQVQRYERERTKNSSTYWMIFELIWRDFFRFLGVQQGTQLFKLEGIQHTRYTWNRDRDAFVRWCRGETGLPFIDANMRELRATGFMSNRGRQNVASFLAKDLEIDWRWGAAWFESLLIDYDPCSNWGNWQYVAGVGNDPRDRRFNIQKQARRYDEKGAYVRHWLPFLEELPNYAIHQPTSLSPKELRERYNIRIDVDYPRPMIDLRIYGR